MQSRWVLAAHVTVLRTRSYLLGAVSIFLEYSGEKFQFLSEGILVTKSFGSVYNGSQDWVFVCRVVKWIPV